jgi:hypothetical protein
VTAPGWIQIAAVVASPILGLLMALLAWILNRQIARLDALKGVVDSRTAPLARYDERINGNKAAIGEVSSQLAAINKKLDRLLEGRQSSRG